MAKLQRNASMTGLLYASIGGMIGSGWLFSSLIAAKQAGVYSILSWVIGAIVITFIALVYAELTTMFPKSGALIHLSHLSHGALLGRVWGWILMLAYVAVPPVETMAVLAYANNYTSYLVNPINHVLTGIGFAVAAVLLAVVVLLNFFAVKWVLKINSAITFWKIIIPILTIVILFTFSFHPHNFAVTEGSHNISSIFSTVATAGIVFSYFGFRNAIDLAGETSNPSRNIPLAIFGSILLVLLIYVGLQIAFIAALPEHLLAHGWGHLTFKGSAGPIAAILSLLGVFWWAYILYADAFLSPLGTGYIYTTTASRVIMAAGETNTAPKVFSFLNKQGVPWVALIIVYVLGIIFFFPFPSWQKMVSYVSSITVLSYSIGPIVLLQLRLLSPNRKRPFKLRAVWVVAPLAFFGSNAIIFWSGYNAISFMFLLIMIFFFIYMFWQYFVAKVSTETVGWSFVWWVIPYFIGMWVISFYGPTILGGKGSISFGLSMLYIFILSIIILAFALRSGLSKEKFRENIEYISSMQSYAETSSENNHSF